MSETIRRFSISPKKKCAGIMLFRNDAGVLYKLKIQPAYWRTPGAETRLIELPAALPGTTDSIQITTYEKDLIQGPGLDGLSQFLERSDHDGANDTDDGSVDDDGGELRLADFLVEVPLTRHTTTTADIDGDDDGDLWRLAAEADSAAELHTPTAARCISFSLPDRSGIDDDWSELAGRAGRHLPEIRRYLATRFVIELSRSVHLLRPGYLRQQDWRGSVRGKLVTSGLAERASHRRAAVLCEFDHHTINHPLHVLLRKALTLCLGTVDETRESDATYLLRAVLAGVDDIGLQQAQVLARTVNPTRATRALAPALQLAKALLRSHDPVADDDGVDEAEAVLVRITINTARLWELIVVEAFRQRYDVEEQFTGNTSDTTTSNRTKLYTGLGGEQPADIALWHRDTSRAEQPFAIVDCKYKNYGRSGGPSSADRMQIYAYSGLYGPRFGAGLVHVAHDHDGGTSRHERHDQGPVLVLIQLPFPERSELLSTWIQRVDPIIDAADDGWSPSHTDAVAVDA